MGNRRYSISVSGISILNCRLASLNILCCDCWVWVLNIHIFSVGTLHFNYWKFLSKIEILFWITFGMILRNKAYVTETHLTKKLNIYRLLLTAVFSSLPNMSCAHPSWNYHHVYFCLNYSNDHMSYQVISLEHKSELLLGTHTFLILAMGPNRSHCSHQYVHELLVQKNNVRSSIISPEHLHCNIEFPEYLICYIFH